MSNVIDAAFRFTPTTDPMGPDFGTLCGLEYCDNAALPDVGIIAEGVEPGDHGVPPSVRLISVPLCLRCAVALEVPFGGGRHG